MALEDLPTHLTIDEKRNVFATDSGWETDSVGNDNPDAQREVLTAINQLATTLGPAVVKSINWKAGSGAYTKTAGGTIGLEFVFNEEVTGFSNTTAPVTNETDAGRSLTLDFVEVNDNIATFDITIPANSNSLDVADVISISSTDTLTLNGDTILGFNGGSASLDISAIDPSFFPSGITIG
jgi:hypothetical protein